MRVNEQAIQNDIIRSILQAKEKGKDIQQTIRELAKEFDITQSMIKGIIERSAMYGLERCSGPVTEGKNWKPLDHTKAIEKLTNKIYQVEARVVRLENLLVRREQFNEIFRVAHEKGLFDELLPTKKPENLLLESETIDIEEQTRINRVRNLIDETREHTKGQMDRFKKKAPSGSGLTFTELQEVNKK